MQREADRPALLQPGEGETIFDRPARTIRVLADREELALLWFRYEPGEEGPEPHVHRQHTDAFYVLEGELEFRLGPELERVTGTAGALAAAPPNVVHTFRNAGAATAVFLNVHAPNTGFVDMLRARRDRRAVTEFDQFDPPADGGRPLSDAVFRGAGTGRWVALGGTNVVSKAEATETDGFFTFAETALAPGSRGSALHGNDAVAAVYVVEGTVSVELGDERVDAGAGAFVLVPPGLAHTLANRTGETALVLELLAPGG